MNRDHPYPPTQPERGWWSRNWMWFVPAGCLTMILIVVLSCAGLFALVFGTLKSNAVYQRSLAAAKTNPQIVFLLGTPIQPTWFVSGSFNFSGSSGHARLSYTITGPHGSGTVFAEGDKHAGKWTFTKAFARVGNAKHKKVRVNLLKQITGP